MKELFSKFFPPPLALEEMQPEPEADGKKKGGQKDARRREEKGEEKVVAELEEKRQEKTVDEEGETTWEKEEEEVEPPPTWDLSLETLKEVCHACYVPSVCLCKDKECLNFSSYVWSQPKMQVVNYRWAASV